MNTRRAILGALAAFGLMTAAPLCAQETAAPAAAPAWPVHAGPEVAADELVYGDENAEQTLYEYVSMTCPHCREFTLDTLPSVRKELIDTGKLRLVVRQFPLDEKALAAARLVRCGGPRKGMGYMKMLFGAQRDWVLASPEETMNLLARYAKIGGLSQDQFEACMRDEALGTAIAEGAQKAMTTWKVRSTPTFVRGDGTIHGGALTLEALTAFLEGGTG